MAKKVHHYVPEFYLKGFVDPGSKSFLWVGDSRDGRVYKLSPEKAARCKNYYTVVSREGEDEVFEQFLARTESEAAPLLERMITGAGGLDRFQRETFALFVATLMTRVPRSRTWIEDALASIAEHRGRVGASNKEHFYREVRELMGDDVADTDIEKARQGLLTGEDDLQVNPVVSLQPILTVTPRIAAMIEDMRWQVLTMPIGSHLVTSDFPVNLMSTIPRPAGVGVGLAHKDARLVMPLNRHALLVASHDGPAGRGVARKPQVDAANMKTTLWAWRYVYGPEKALVTVMTISRNRLTTYLQRKMEVDKGKS